ncbi:MAG: hypothetical protein AAF086_07795 [Planctomycetota bacterium]
MKCFAYPASRLTYGLALVLWFALSPSVSAMSPEEAQAIVDKAYAEIQQEKAATLAGTESGTGLTQVQPEYQKIEGLGKFGQDFFSGAESLLGDASLRLFQPTTRIYFDAGDDDDDEPDIFDDGSLVPVITLAEVRFTNYLFPATAKQAGKEDSYNLNDKTPWSWGFATGIGATIAAESGEDSTAPIVLATAGMFLEYDLSGFGKTKADYKKWTEVTDALGLPNSGPTLGLEAGWVYGLSADENFEDKDDSAWYIGLTVYVPF